MMRISRPGLALAAILAVTAPLAAQQPAPPPPPRGSPGMMHPGMKMEQMEKMKMMDVKAMDSLDARIDSATARMNRSTGETRSAAMADLLNALVVEHRAMHAHMAQMGHMSGMPGKPMQHPMPGHPMPGMARPDTVKVSPK